MTSLKTIGGAVAVATIAVATNVSTADAMTQTGIASFYSGGRTASGERIDHKGFTAAHRTLPFGTRLRVTRLSTGKTIIVRINDRGPFIRGRIIDVSKTAAVALGFHTSGVTQVKIERVD